MEELFRKHKIKIAYLFGSQKEKGLAFLKGETIDVEKHSDLDIGIVFEKLPEKRFEAYGDIFVDLSLLFKPFDIDIVFLQETDALFQYEAIKDALIYCKDESFLDDYEEMVAKQAADLSYKKIEFEKDFLEAVKDGYFEIADR